MFFDSVLLCPPYFYLFGMTLQKYTHILNFSFVKYRKNPFSGHLLPSNPIKSPDISDNILQHSGRSPKKLISSYSGLFCIYLVIHTTIKNNFRRHLNKDLRGEYFFLFMESFAYNRLGKSIVFRRQTS